MNKNNNFKKNIRGIMPFIKPYKWKFLISILMIFTFNITIVLAPTFEGMITSQIASDIAKSSTLGNININFNAILKIVILLFTIYIIKTLAQIISINFLTDAIQHAMEDLRNALQNKIRKLPVRYFDNHHFGDILSRITNDIDAVSNAFQQSFTQIVSGILTVTLALTMMYLINPKIAIIGTMIIPLSLLVTKLVVGKSQRLFKAQQDTLGELNSTITEMYTGYNEILLYNQQNESIAKFKEINKNLKDNAFKAQFVSSTIAPLNSLVTYLTIGAVAVVGSVEVLAGTFLIGQLQAFIRYIWQINDPLSQISNLSSQIQAAFAALSRIIELLNETEEIPEAEKLKEIDRVEGNVTFEHVKFGYYQENLMNDLNVEVKSGQTVAIVGPTGAGKTTIINLLLRFYDVKGGSIKIDGIDIRDMAREKLRSMFGMVLQDTWLFSGTIYDNIRYGRLDARNDEIIDAAKMANVDHFIRTLPGGYNFYINEEANNISQGEKQLLTIARAILKNPQILILDEATSSVDTRLEKILQEAMQRVMIGRTSFVIAHRLSTIKNADLILVINNGDIVEQGTHRELLAKKGEYEKLYNSQFANN